MAGRPILECGDEKLARLRAQSRKSTSARRARLKEAGLCHDCGKVPEGKRIYCDACQRRRVHAYKTKYRDGRVAAHKIKHKELKLLVFDTYGGRFCACCGETHLEFLSIDHVANDGAAHRRSMGWTIGAGNIYSLLKARNFPPGFQVLCMNCNFAKGHFGGCPHERERPGS